MLKKVATVLLLIFSISIVTKADEGWKSLENWRKLETGLSPRTVKKILGEPERIEGGNFTYWYYPNRGQITFYERKLYNWDEPRSWGKSDDGVLYSSPDVILGVTSLIILAILSLGYIAPLLWVLVSGRSHGGAKFGWFIVVLLFSWLGLAAFLILTQSAKKQASPP